MEGSAADQDNNNNNNNSNGVSQGNQDGARGTTPGQGEEDWSPLAELTGSRPLVSKYGLARYSPLEWRKAHQALLGAVPSVDSLEHESKNIIANISADIDNEQRMNTVRLRQRAADIGTFHDIARDYSRDIKEELDLLAQCRVRIRKALETVNVVDGINKECREIRKNRLTEDLVRDEVEEELFQESGLCQQIQDLYRAALNDFENQFIALKKVSVEIQAMWSDQREALELETENIGLTNSSPQVFFCQGVARLDPGMSSQELWEKYTRDVLDSVKQTLDNSRNFRRKINSPVLQDAAKDLASQADKVVKAFVSRIEQTQNALADAEAELDKVLKEIAHCEQLYLELETLGRQIDFSLKVVQTRLDNRRKRPGAENCRDKAQYGLMGEIKTVCQRVTAIQQQLEKLNETIVKLYAIRKNLERQIHVKRHTLSIDCQRCMTFRKQFPNPTFLLGF